MNLSPGYSTVNKIKNLKFCWSLHCLRMDYLSQRYAFMNRSHILGFPNRIPHVDWHTGLPKFQDKKGEGDDAAIHLISFHLHIHRLRIDFPEDCLMKMFMATLEENAIFWYETRPPASISSIKDFY